MALSDRDKRTLKIGGVVAGVLLLGVLAMNVFAGGDEEPPPPIDRPDTTESPQPTPTTEPPVVPPAPVFTGRDPFSIPPGFSTSGTTSTSTSTGTGTSTGTSTSTSSGTGSGTGSGSSQPGNGSSMTVGGNQVTLLDVFTTGGSGAAQVEIDGQVYNVTVGETFGPGDNYELRSTSGNCATFLYGDESFTLCVTPEK
jgi:hypothetical protein